MQMISHHFQENQASCPSLGGPTDTLGEQWSGRVWWLESGRHFHLSTCFSARGPPSSTPECHAFDRGSQLPMTIRPQRRYNLYLASSLPSASVQPVFLPLALLTNQHPAVVASLFKHRPRLKESKYLLPPPLVIVFLFSLHLPLHPSFDTS